jgi:hypothetical protein
VISVTNSDNQWEILGELAQRLHHKEEAKDAFQRCLDAKFSAKALLKLLETYADEGDLQRTLNTAIRLTTYHHRWYMDASYPSMIAHYLFKLGLVHGHAKISYTLLSMVNVLGEPADSRTYRMASLRSCRATSNTARHSAYVI